MGHLWDSLCDHSKPTPRFSSHHMGHCWSISYHSSLAITVACYCGAHWWWLLLCQHLYLLWHGPIHGCIWSYRGCRCWPFSCSWYWPTYQVGRYHLFFCILRCHLNDYNSYHSSLHNILCHLPRRQTGGCLWFEGNTFDDGYFETFCKNCKFPIHDLSSQSVCSPEDLLYNCNFEDINLLSTLLGIPWELSKDIHFHFQVLFIGLLWDLPRLTIGLGDAKKAKYLAATVELSSVQMHVLLDIQQLYGKLLHACLVIPTGWAYLTSLEAMLGTSSSCPFMPHHSICHLNDDLAWWTEQLSRPILERAIPQPCTFRLWAAHLIHPSFVRYIQPSTFPGTLWQHRNCWWMEEWSE